MLDSVLVARDRFLAPGGSLFPSHARLYLAPMRSTHAHHRKAEFQARTGHPLAVWQSALCRHACLYVAPCAGRMHTAVSNCPDRKQLSRRMHVAVT